MVGVLTVFRGRSWSVGNSFWRKGSGSFECGGELARRLLMVSREQDRALGASRSWRNGFESGRLFVASFYSRRRWIWKRAFRCSGVCGLSGGRSGADIL